MVMRKKSATIHELEGRETRCDDAPSMEIVEIDKPSGMSFAASKHWDDIACQLNDACVLSALDSDALVMYCETWAIWKDAIDGIAEHGLAAETEGKMFHKSPYVAIANDAHKTLKAMQCEFGMTPSSRAHATKVEKPKKEEWDDF